MAEQGIAVFLGPVGQVRDETLDLLAGGLAEGLGAAEVDGVGLDEVGIELGLDGSAGRGGRGPWDHRSFGCSHC